MCYRLLISALKCIFGFPIFESVLPRLEELTQHIKIDLLVDHEQQITLLEASQNFWNVLIKIDVGAERAGLPGDDPRLKALVKKIDASGAVNLKGFYCHANHSYNCRTENDTKEMLHHEVSGVLKAVALLPSSRQLLVSIGATPTAHVIETLRATIPANVSLELHAGKSIHHLRSRTCANLDQATSPPTTCNKYPQVWSLSHNKLLEFSPT